MTYNKFGKQHCTQHRIDYDFLYQLVLSKIREAAQAAMDSCSPISDIRASKEYRKAMIGVYTKRAIKQCLEQF